jgi:hypothetical protein
MTDSQKQKLLLLLESSGFSGCRSGKPVCSGVVYTSPLAFVRAIGLEGLLMAHTDIELQILGHKFKEIKHSVFAFILEHGEVRPVASGPEELEKVHSGILDIDTAIKTNIHLYRSYLEGGVSEYLNKGSNFDILMYSSSSRSLIKAGKFNISSILDSKKMSKEDLSNLPKIWPKFDPYCLGIETTVVSSELGIEFPAINTYCPPKWRFVKASPMYSGIIKQLMENLFPLEEERQYIFDWLRQAIVGRNETVLVLVGDRGVGKTLFSKLFFSLVGEQYSAIAKRETLTEKFNSVLKDARAVAFEETGMEGDPESIERMKAFCNSKLSIEAKGENAFTAENFASMVMSLNGNSRLGVKPQERRFSIPRLGVTNFSKIVPEVDIAKFSRDLDAEEKSEEFLESLSEFGEFLLARPASKTIATPLKGQAYYEITAQSLAEWETAIINYVIENGEIGKPLFLKDIKRSMGNREVRNMFPVKDSKISSFLQDYRHIDVAKIGVLTRIDSDGKNNNVQVIMPDETFLKSFGANYKEGAVIVKDTEVEDDIL